MDGVSSLLDNSLIQQVAGEYRETRFAMIETVREYALERLACSGDDEISRKAHAAYCLVLAEEGNAPLAAAERNDWFARCDAEHENFRAALDYLVSRSLATWAQRMGFAICGFWERRAHFAEGRARLEAILSLGGDADRQSREWAQAASRAGALASVQGDFERMLALHRQALDVYRALGDRTHVITQLSGLGLGERERENYAAARSYFEECLTECRELGDRAGIAAAVSNLAGVLGALGDRERARSMLQEAEQMFRELENWDGAGWSLNHLGDLARDYGDLAEAMRAFQEGLAVFRQRDNQWGVARSCADLGYLACLQHECTTARTWLREALRIFQALHHQRAVAHVLEGFAMVAAEEGDVERALTLAGAAASLRKRIDAPARRRAEARLQRVLQPAWEQLGRASAEDLWKAGSHMTLEEVIRLALEDDHAHRSTGS
jgi:tetratricopeptide (TPR) repeat protein